MLSFASATGNLPNRVGKIGLLIKQMSAYQSSQKTNLIDPATGAVGQFVTESDLQALVGSAYIGALNSCGSSIGSLVQSLATQTINRMIFRDSPQLSQSLQTLQTTMSLQEVIRQMQASGATVLRATVAATPSVFTGLGNGVVVVSVKRPEDGLMQENAFAETLLVKCLRDSYTGNATVGSEPLSITGAGGTGSPFNFDWPLGSNARTAVTAIHGAANNGQGNLLTNSGFDNFTNNIPNNFTLDVGTAGTHTVKETILAYDGATALKIVGDGANLTSLKQQFNKSTGTYGTLQPLSQYGVNLFLRRDGLAAAAGTLVVELVDQNGAVINDAAGTANTFSIDLTALSTSYNAFSGAFRTPAALPTSQFLRLRLSTALTNGRAVYLDRMSLGLMTRAYTAGPYLSIHSGSVPFSASGSQIDFATVAVTNSRGAGGTLNTFQTLFARLFPDMLNKGLLLPSSALPSISDSLIG